jgi:hypothetical protein
MLPGISSVCLIDLCQIYHLGSLLALLGQEKGFGVVSRLWIMMAQDGYPRCKMLIAESI